MSFPILEEELKMVVVAYPHEEDDDFNIHLESRLGDTVITDQEVDSWDPTYNTLNEYFKHKDMEAHDVQDTDQT